MVFSSLGDIISHSERFDAKDKDLIKNNGVVFTTKNICDSIIKNLNPKITDIICEPSVGKGIFVFSLLEYFRSDNNISQLVNFVENNLFCYDINTSFISELKEMLQAYFNILGHNVKLNLSNIKVGDFLKDEGTYDIIIGNPPYIRIQNLNKEYLTQIKCDLKSLQLGNVDMYYAFIEKSLMSAKKIGFITPNSFIKTKSGEFLRKLLIDRINYIYDFNVDKVWNSISTYTCIFTCSDISDTITYQTKNNIIVKNKSEMSQHKWMFNSIGGGEHNVMDMIHSYNGGIATLCDKVFKVEKDNKHKIERDICVKIIKGTKTKDFSEYELIIYPYDENNNIISEQILMDKYPNCYKYLLDNKDKLLNRDKGKTYRYDAWYAYGRKQGMLKKTEGIKVILPMTYLKSTGIDYLIVPDNENCVVVSGVLVDVKKEYFNEFINIIKSDNFTSYCESNNRLLSDKKDSDDCWITITAQSLSKYSF